MQRMLLAGTCLGGMGNVLPHALVIQIICTLVRKLINKLTNRLSIDQVPYVA